MHPMSIPVSAELVCLAFADAVHGLITAMVTRQPRWRSCFAQACKWSLKETKQLQAEHAVPPEIVNMLQDFVTVQSHSSKVSHYRTDSA